MTHNCTTDRSRLNPVRCVRQVTDTSRERRGTNGGGGFGGVGFQTDTCERANTHTHLVSRTRYTYAGYGVVCIKRSSKVIRKREVVVTRDRSTSGRTL